MKSLYLEVHDQLMGLSEHKPEGHAHSRFKQLSDFITGMISKGNSSMMPDIGSGLPQDIYANSKTDAASRFVGNKWTDFETHFLPFAIPFLTSILSLISVYEGIRLVIDGSQMGKKGYFKEADHVNLIQKAHTIIARLLPEGMSVTILGEGEFDGIELQKLSNKAHRGF